MYPDTQPHRLCTIRSYICRNIRSPTRTFAEYPTGCCYEESFNVFTPPMENRVEPGMLIARGTIVGFHDGMRSSSHVVSYIGNNFVLFPISTHVYMRNMSPSSRAFTSFLPTFDPTVTIERCEFQSEKFY